MVKTIKLLNGPWMQQSVSELKFKNKKVNSVFKLIFFY